MAFTLSDAHRTYCSFLFTTVLALSLAVGTLLAQTPGAGPDKLVAKSLMEGDYYRQQELYAEASRYYATAVRLDPDNLAAIYRLAECHRMTFNYEMAEKGYGSVYHSQSTGYPLVLFYYALMQKMNGKYEEALRHFGEFIHKAGHKPSSEMALTVKRAQDEREGCEMAMKQKMLLQSNYQFHLLGPPANSPYHDYAPAVAGTDSLLLITSSRPGSKGRLQDTKMGESLSDFYLFQSPDTGRTWLEKRRNNPLASINTKWSEGSGTFNRKCDKFYFTSCQQSNSHCEIFVTRLINGKWQEPEKLNRHINQPGYDSRHPMLSSGGDSLFLVSNRPGGKGLNDIWLSISSGDDNWGPPVNLGAPINTPMNELSPFYDKAGGALFFASDGHKGLGGLDIIMAKRKARHEWQLTPMSPPFNSHMDDAFLTMGTHTGYLASNRPGGNGHFDIYTFQLISHDAPLIALDRNPQKELPDLAYLQDYNLDYFSPKDQLQVDRMISKKTAGRLYRTTLPLSPEDQQFYVQLSAAERARLNQVTDQLYQQMSPEKREELRARDALYYQLLPQEDRKRIDRMVKVHQQALKEQMPLVLTGNDASYYEELSNPEKKLLNRVIASRMDEPHSESTDPSGQEADFQYETLPALAKDRINRIAAARQAAQQHNEPVQLSEEDERFYAQLSPEEKNRLDQLVESRMESAKYGKKSAPAETFDYQQLPLEDQRRINRIVAARRAAQQHNEAVNLSEEDAFYYAHLSAEEKARIDRIVATQSDAPAPAFDYQQLPLDEKKRIDRIVAARRAAQQHNQTAQLSPEDEQFYNQLTTEEKSQIELMAAAPPRMAARRAAQHRPFVSKAISDIESAERSTPFHTGNYESITIGGKLMDVDTDKPAEGVEILLVNSEGQLVKSTVINEQGHFQFVHLTPDEDYNIRVNEPPRRISEASRYRIQDLQMMGYDQPVADVLYEPVYFDFDQYTLRPEARKVLDELTTLCLSKPTMQLEINAFTDITGSDAYNLELSRKRGQTVYAYLVAQGINAQALVVRFSGKRQASHPITDTAGRQADRRVEIILKGAPYSYRPSTFTYILPTRTTLSAIARTFGMTVAELKALNDFASETVAAYRPVRVRNHRNEVAVPPTIPAEPPQPPPGFLPVHK